MMRSLIIAAALMLPVAASAQVAQEGKWPSALSQENLNDGEERPRLISPEPGAWSSTRRMGQ